MDKNKIRIRKKKKKEECISTLGTNKKSSQINQNHISLKNSTFVSKTQSKQKKTRRRWRRNESHSPFSPAVHVYLYVIFASWWPNQAFLFLLFFLFLPSPFSSLSSSSRFFLSFLCRRLPLPYLYLNLILILFLSYFHLYPSFAS